MTCPFYVGFAATSLNSFPGEAIIQVASVFFFFLVVGFAGGAGVVVARALGRAVAPVPKVEAGVNHG